jgi:hypothetical protein
MSSSLPATSTEWRAYLTGRGLGVVLEQPDDERIEQTVLALEQKLGTRLPASFRSYLLATQDWTPATNWRWQSPEVERVFWLREGMPDLIEAWADFEDIVEIITPCLVALDRENGVFWLLDPTVISDDGEWTAYEWAAGDGEDPLPFPSFAALVDERAPEGEG